MRIRGGPLLLTGVIAAVASLAGLPVAAQPAPPNAGRLLQQTEPRPAPPLVVPPAPAPLSPPSVAPVPAAADAVRFRLTGVRFSGHTVFDSPTLAALAEDRIGTDVTLEDLEEIAERVTRKYRERGYFLAQAIVPRQELVGGVVEFSVIEGHLAKLRVERAEGVNISEARLRAYLGRLVPGRPLTEQALERAMLLLSDLPGIAVQSSLQEGEEAGTVDLTVEVAAGKRIAYQAEVDNFGQESSGEYRIGGSVRVANPFGIGDNFDARALLTSSSRTVFGRVSYERPIGGNGVRAGIGYSELGYDLGDQFSALGADGFARVIDVSLQKPFERRRIGSLLGSVGLQRKWVEDRFTAFDFTADRDLLNLTAGLTLDRRDRWLGGGFVNATVFLTAGTVDVASGLARELDQGPGGRNTDGTFYKLNYSLSRLQALVPNWTLFGAVIGQLASRNLDNAERFGVGGPRAVRAYSTGALVADEGGVATAELRYSLNPQTTLSVFYDAGWAAVNRHPAESTFDNNQSIRGWGFGLFWGRPGNFLVQGSLAWRDTPAVFGDSNDRSPRLYLQGVKYF